MIKFKEVETKYDLIVYYDPVNYRFKYNPIFQTFKNSFIAELVPIINNEIKTLQFDRTKELSLNNKSILLINHPVRNYNLIFTFNSQNNTFNYKNKDGDEIDFISVYKEIIRLPLIDCMYDDDITSIHNKILNETKILIPGTFSYFDLYYNDINNVFITVKLVNENT